MSGTDFFEGKYLRRENKKISFNKPGKSGVNGCIVSKDRGVPKQPIIIFTPSYVHSENTSKYYMFSITSVSFSRHLERLNQVDTSLFILKKLLDISTNELSPKYLLLMHSILSHRQILDLLLKLLRAYYSVLKRRESFFHDTVLYNSIE